MQVDQKIIIFWTKNKEEGKDSRNRFPSIFFILLKIYKNDNIKKLKENRNDKRNPHKPRNDKRNEMEFVIVAKQMNNTLRSAACGNPTLNSGLINGMK